MRNAKIIATLLAITLIMLSFASCKGKGKEEKSTETEEQIETIFIDDTKNTTGVEATTAAPETTASATGADTSSQPQNDGGTSKPKPDKSGSTGGGELISGGYASSGNLSQNTGSSSGGTPSSEGGTSYEDISCRSASYYKKVFIAYSDSSNAVSMMLPGDWSITATGGGAHSISRDGASIGTLYSSAYTTNGMSAVASDSGEQLRADISYNRSIMQSGSAFYQCITVTYADNGASRQIVIETGYGEIDSTTIANIKNSSMLTALKSSQGFNIIPLSESNGSKNILVAGNSFISSSEIGGILQQFCNSAGKYYTINDVSWGYATAANFAGDEETMYEISHGHYSVVFMCGLYGTGDVDAMITIYNACRASNTILVALPAHNESDDSISTLRNRSSSVIILNWKAEINNLIKDGVDYYEFCYDDMHQHSRELAGYVGAHMIFRALFGSTPPDLPYNYYIDQSYADNQLGEYAKSGQRYLIDKSIVNFIG